MRRIHETLNASQIANIIPVIEQGIELEKATYLATRDPESRSRISDSCVFLSELYIRQMNINRTLRELPD